MKISSCRHGWPASRFAGCVRRHPCRPDSSSPCWNDAIGILVELTETHPASYISKKPKATKKSEIFDSRLRTLRGPRVDLLLSRGIGLQLLAGLSRLSAATSVPR